ncbi:MAG: CDP-alcohol phosphatidyltransferase family protein [Candidatus Rhabdochlamydia sp.]
MINISNGLSLLRAPLALLFLIESPMLRLMATFLAMLTDSIDGYLARRSKTASRFGAVLDPAMDKFFVFFALGALYFENRLELWQLLAMVSRDFALCIFGLYLGASNQWQTYEFRAIRWGKITTALQFIVLIALSLHYQVPDAIFYTFIGFAALGLYELFQFKKVTA